MSDQEQWDAWSLDENGCAPDCPIRILGEQSGERKSNTTSTRGRGSAIYANGKGFANTLQEVGQSIGYGDTGTASRYFKTFRPMVDDPDDETPQERGETQLLKSDEVQSGELPIDQVLHGDALAVLKTLPDNSVDAIVTDPPSSIFFMGKTWDSDKGGRDQWIAWLADIMREGLRCLRPGGHAFVWALPRTSHMTGMALENAGFEIRDEVSHLFGSDSRVQSFVASLDEEQRSAFAQLIDAQGANSVLLHLFGSGFPKSLSVSAAIDKHLGQEREVVGKGHSGKTALGDATNKVNGYRDKTYLDGKYDITAPATPESAQFSGWGSNLKPSHENWLLVRKPLAEKTIAAQVLATGTGAINVDASRIGLNGDDTSRKPVSAKGWKNSSTLNGTIDDNWQKGRFPSNTLFSHSPACVALGEKRVRANGPACTTGSTSTKNAYGEYSQRSNITHRDEDGCETVAAYSCAPDCPVAELDRQSKGTRADKASASGLGGWRNQYVGGDTSAYLQSTSYHDTGGASRYFKTFLPVEDMVPFTYQSKASRKDRSSNGAVNNTHPTCKPLSLMKYLCNMVCPPGGIVLDMFGGSGTTALACIAQGFRYILVEAEQEYVDIARARIAHAHASVSRPVEQEAVEYDCAPDCPVHLLGEMSGVSKSGVAVKRNLDGHTYNTHQPWGLKAKVSEDIGYGDTGTAARYFKTFPPEPTLWDMAEEEAPS